MTPVHGPRRTSEGASAPVAVPSGYPLPPINPFHGGVPHPQDEQRQWQQQQQQHAPPPHEARPPYNSQNPLEHRYPPPPPLPAQQIPGGMVQTAHTQSLTQRAAPRQRTAVACRYCRRRKIRCSGFLTSADGRCQNCIRLDQECVFTPVAANVADIHIAQHTPPLYQHSHPHQQSGYPPPPPPMPQQGHLPHSRSMASVYPGPGPGPGPESVTPSQRGYYDHEYSQSPSTAPGAGPPSPHRGSVSSGWSQPPPPQPAPPSSQPPAPIETPISLPVFAQHKRQRSHEYASSWPERATPAGAPYPQRSYPSSPPPRRVESPRGGGGYARHGSYGGAGEYIHATGAGPERQQGQGSGGSGGLYPPENQWRQPSYGGGGHPTHQGSTSPLPPPATAPPASARREGEGPLALLSRAAERERYQPPPSGESRQQPSRRVLPVLPSIRTEFAVPIPPGPALASASASASGSVSNLSPGSRGDGEVPGVQGPRSATAMSVTSTVDKSPVTPAAPPTLVGAELSLSSSPSRPMTAGTGTGTGTGAERSVNPTTGGVSGDAAGPGLRPPQLQQQQPVQVQRTAADIGMLALLSPDPGPGVKNEKRKEVEE
ncbi:hypothetical protein YB2330_005367 [Saitoella coloradoensis]